MYSPAATWKASEPRCCIRRRRSPSVTIPARRPSCVEDRGHAETFAAHLVDYVGQFRIEIHPRQGVAGVHEAFGAQQLPAEATAGMQRGEIAFLEAAAFEQGDGERVANGERGGGGGRRCEIERARFFFHANIEDDLACGRECGTRVAGERDDRERPSA